MRQSRTHTCGELRLTDAGKTVTIAGWMENLREVGANFAFLVLRDYYGTTQVVIQNEEMMARVKGVNKESTLQVTGIVRERESKTPKQATGCPSRSTRARTPTRTPGSSTGSWICGTRR